MHAEVAVAPGQRGLQRLDHPGAPVRAQAHPVLYHLQCSRGLRMDADIALVGQQFLDLIHRKAIRDRHREGDDQARFGCNRMFAQVLENALRGIAGDPSPAAPAKQGRGPCEQQLDVVVELGHGPDRGPRRAHRVGLVDGDGRRDALDALHLRAVHAVQELAGVGGEGLHVAALALGVDGVEGQRRLARTTHPGHHDQLPQGQLQIQPLEIVLASAFDADVFLRHCDMGLP